MNGGRDTVTTRHIAGIEFRRTGALLVAASLATVGTVLIVSKQEPFNPYAYWSSSWAFAADTLSDYTIVLGPLAGTVAAWVGGRECRRRLTELLATTARPALSRTGTTWAALTLGLVLGMAGVIGVLAAGIAPTVSYQGGRWPASLLLVLLGIVVCSSIGFAAGRVIPGRLVAPAVGIVLYVGTGMVSYLDVAWEAFTPLAPGQLPSSEGQELIGWVIPVATVWFVALAVTALLLGAGSHRWTALAPALVAVLVAVPLTGASGADGPYDTAWLQRDLQARQRVCTSDTPEVCVARVHAGLLDEVTPLARDLLTRVQPFLSVDRVAEVRDFDEAVPAGTLAMPSLQGRSRFLRPGLAHPETIAQDTIVQLTWVQCDGGVLEGANQSPWVTAAVAESLFAGAVSPFYVDDPAVGAIYARLAADPAAARQWMDSFVPAAANCDLATLALLAQP